MAQFMKVGSRAELEDLAGGKLVEAGGHRVAVFNVGGSYYAIESACPHRGAPLAEGIIGGRRFCPEWGSRNETTFGIRPGFMNDLTEPCFVFWVV